MTFQVRLPRADVGDGIENFAGARLYFYDFGTTNAKTTYSNFALSVANAHPVVADANGLFGDIFVDQQCSVELRTSADVTVYGPTELYAPEDGITSLAATGVAVTDAAGHFTGTNAETVLAELGLNWGQLSRINTWTAVQTLAAAIQMQDNELRRPLLLDYAVANNSVSSSSGTVTLDLSTGNSFETTLTENITTVTLSNPPASGNYGQLVWRITQDGGGGAYTVTFPAAVQWPGGTAPTITTSNDAVDEITLRTTDGGTTWRGSFSQAFA